MAIRQDCPICGRKGNEGRIFMDDDEKIAKHILTAGGAILGTMAAPGVGTLAGGYAAEKLGKFFAKQEHKIGGQVKYRFTCQNPGCKHEWVDWITE